MSLGALIGRHRMDRWVVMNPYTVKHMVTQEVAPRCWADFDCGELCASNCKREHQCREKAGPNERSERIGLCDRHYRSLGNPLHDPREET